MAIIYRAVKGANLTAAEVDNNFLELKTALDTLTGSPPTAVSIDTIAVVGDQITFTMTDASTRGPFTLPTATWRERGAWTASTVYLKNDVVSNGGNIYRVLHNVTSDITFDPAETDIDGFVYSLILAPATQPNDLHVFVGGVFSNDQLVLRYIATRRWQLPINLGGSQFLAGVTATADADIILYKNAGVIGTVTFAMGATDADIDFVAAITFEIGDIFKIVADHVADTTLADVSFDILATRL